MAGLQASCSVNDLEESRFSCAEDLRVPRAPPSLRLLRGALRRVTLVIGNCSLCPSLSQTRKLEQSSKRLFHALWERMSNGKGN